MYSTNSDNQDGGGIIEFDFDSPSSTSPPKSSKPIYSQQLYSNSTQTINRPVIYERRLSHSSPSINVDSGYAPHDVSNALSEMSLEGTPQSHQVLSRSPKRPLGGRPDPSPQYLTSFPSVGADVPPYLSSSPSVRADVPPYLSSPNARLPLHLSPQPPHTTATPDLPLHLSSHSPHTTPKPDLPQLTINSTPISPQLSSPIKIKTTESTPKHDTLTPNPIQSSPSSPTTPTSSKRTSFLKVLSPLRRHHRKDSNSSVHGDEDNEQIWEEKANQLGLSVASPKDSLDEPKYSNNKTNESNLQRAINLHEQGKIEESTILFKELATPIKEGGQGMPLAQLLYGLCLRHGWGCQVNETLAFTYLKKAAYSTAELQQYDHTSTKGELVLAIFELGNSFRNGWGCEKDDYAAKTYYETAARLGDLDAMIEVAQCYLLGIGTKKNKKLSAKYYRMAEKQGRIEVGNSWIW